MRFMILGCLVVLGACAQEPPRYQAPSMTAAVRNPIVAYNYRTESERVRVHQSAIDYCGSYGTTAVANSGSTNPDGSQVMTFECSQTVLPPPGTGMMPFPIP